MRTQSNLACSYDRLRRPEEALLLWRDVYSVTLRLSGEEHESTLAVANNYASLLKDLERFEEAKSLLRKTMPVARRVLGENDSLTLTMRWNYARSLWLCEDTGPTLADLREAVTTLEDTERIARRVLGGAHPLTMDIEVELRYARIALCAREATQPSGDA